MRTGWASALKNSALNDWRSGEDAALTTITISKYLYISNYAISNHALAATTGSGVEERAVHGRGARHRRVDGVALLYQRLAGPRHRARALGIAEQRQDRVGERLRIARRHEAAVLTVPDQLGAAADRRRHDRGADGQRLRDHLRNRLGSDRGEHQDVERRHHLGNVPAKPGQAHVRVEPHVAYASRHLLEADAVADDQQSGGGLARDDRARGFEEDVVALRAPDVGDEPDDWRPAQAQLVADRGPRHAGVEPRAVDAGRDRYHALGRDPGGDHDRANAFAAGDDAIGETIHERAPATDRDRDVAGAHDREAQRLRGGGGEPAVDGAMGVDHAHGTLAHQSPQPEERADVGRAAHANGLGRDRRRLRLAEEGAVGLAGNQRSPAVAPEPAHLRKRADFLAAVAEGGLDVQDGLHEGRLLPRVLE